MLPEEFRTATGRLLVRPQWLLLTRFVNKQMKPVFCPVPPRLVVRSRLRPLLPVPHWSDGKTQCAAAGGAQGTDPPPGLQSEGPALLLCGGLILCACLALLRLPPAWRVGGAVNILCSFPADRETQPPGGASASGQLCVPTPVSETLLPSKPQGACFRE